MAAVALNAICFFEVRRRWRSRHVISLPLPCPRTHAGGLAGLRTLDRKEGKNEVGRERASERKIGPRGSGPK